MSSAAEHVDALRGAQDLGALGSRAHDRRLEPAPAQVVHRKDPAGPQPARRGVVHGRLGIGHQRRRLDPGGARDLLEPAAAGRGPGRGVGEHDPVCRLALPVGRPCHDVAQLCGEQGGHRVRHVTEPDRLRIAQPAPYRTGDQRGLADGPPLGGVPGDDAAVGTDGDDRGRDHRLVPERDHRDPRPAGRPQPPRTSYRDRLQGCTSCRLPRGRMHVRHGPLVTSLPWVAPSRRGGRHVRGGGWSPLRRWGYPDLVSRDGRFRRSRGRVRRDPGPATRARAGGGAG